MTRAGNNFKKILDLLLLPGQVLPSVPPTCLVGSTRLSGLFLRVSGGCQARAAAAVSPAGDYVIFLMISFFPNLIVSMAWCGTAPTYRKDSSSSIFNVGLGSSVEVRLLYPTIWLLDSPRLRVFRLRNQCCNPAAMGPGTDTELLWGERVVVEGSWSCGGSVDTVVSDQNIVTKLPQIRGLLYKTWCNITTRTLT